MANSYYFYNNFIHHVVGNIYYSFLEYITKDITQRFKFKTITTYNKAIQLLKQNNNNSTDTQIKLPAISLDPTEPLKIESKSDTLWRNPTAAMLNNRLFTPIYQDENFKITPGFVRYTSVVDIYCWFDSIYEEIDTQLRFLQIFHSVNRWSKPFGMEVFCPLPDQLYTLTDTDLQGNILNIKWPSDIIPRLLETINKNVPMLPLYLAPMIKLNDIVSIDTKDKDSGEDLATCAFQANFELEFEIPTFYTVITDHQLSKVETSFTINSFSNKKDKDDLEQDKPPNTATEVVSSYFCNTIPGITAQFKEEGETDPSAGIIVPSNVVYQLYKDVKFKIVKSFILNFDGSTNTFTLPNNLPNYDFINIIYKGQILSFEQNGNQISIDDFQSKIGTFLVLLIKKEN